MVDFRKLEYYHITLNGNWQERKQSIFFYRAREREKHPVRHTTRGNLLYIIEVNFKGDYNVRKSRLMMCRNKVFKLIQLRDIMNIEKVIILLYLIKSRIKRIIENIIILRDVIRTCIAVVDSAGSREMYTTIKKRSIVKVKNIRPGLHAEAAVQRDYVKYRVNYDQLVISARSEATVGASAREMTPLVGSVAAGASRRLARWPMVERPSETRGYKRRRRGSSRAQCATKIPCSNIERK